MLQRRSLLTGIGTILCAPAISVAAPLPVKVPIITGAPVGVKTKGYPDGRAVLWRGAIWSAAAKNPPPDEPPYTVQVDGVSHNIPKHGWWQKVTIRRSPVSIINSPTQIISRNRMFPFGDIGIPINAVDARSFPAFKGPFDSSNIVKYMPSGGGGTDRSLVSDEEARFMRTGEAGPMLARALAADSIPINYVDETTGLPIDTVKNFKANTYMNSGVEPFWQFGPLAPLSNGQLYPAYADGWTPGIDHYPSLSYIAFQSTYDMGFLQNLQHAANLPSIQHPASSIHSGLNVPLVEADEQTRELAWGLRNIFYAHVASKDAEAAGINLADYDCLPSSHFKAMLDGNLAYCSKQMNNPDPKRQTFRLLGPNVGHIGMWQCDYLHETLAFAVLTGHTDWVEIYLWVMGNVIARTDGKSGWPVCYPVAYKFDTVQGGEYPSLPCFTWAQAFDNQMVEIEVKLPKADHDAIRANPYNGGKAWNGQEGTTLNACRAVLVMADHLDRKGLSGIRARYPEFDTCLANVQRMVLKTSPRFGCDERWAIIPAKPIIVPPLPA